MKVLLKTLSVSKFVFVKENRKCNKSHQEKNKGERPHN